MPIKQDVYETSTGSVINTQPLISKIKESIIKDDLDKVVLGVHSSGKVKPLFITGALASENQIPLFTHPILIRNFQGNDYLCSDMRLVFNKAVDLEDYRASVRDKPGYELLKSRAILNLSWINNGPSTLKTGFDLASAVFSQWVSQTLGSKYLLDHSDKAIVSVVASYYYQMFFTQEVIPDEEQIQKMAIHSIKTTGIDANTIFNIFEKCKEVSSITDLPRMIIDNISSKRLEGMNAASMITMFKSSWYGNDASEIIKASFEHPPTWIALVHAAISDRAYKTSIIARTADVLAKRGRGDEFMMAYKNMMLDSVSLETSQVVKEFSKEELLAQLG